MMKKGFALWAIYMCVLSCLSGCAQTSEKATNSDVRGVQSTPSAKQPEGVGIDNKPAVVPEKANLSNQTAGQTAPNAPTEESADSKLNKKELAANSEKGQAPLPQLDAAQKKVNLEALPMSLTICTVNGYPITVGEYRRQFKLQQLQLEAAINTSPQARQRLLQEAKARGISLTAQEKEKLLFAARGGKSPLSPDFKEFLKQRHATEAQFNQEVSDVGVAIKTINVMLQQNLLSDLVNRELLCESSKAAHFENKAMNRYLEIKNSPAYKELLQKTGFTPDQLREELIKSELTNLVMEKIQQRAVVGDKDIEDFYKKNAKLFEHKERVRLSQIIISCPNQDIGPVQSVRTQVLKANPKLTGKELDSMVALTIERQKQKAQTILAKAKAGDNFAELANQYTDDIPTKVSKNGGDLGFQQKSQLIPQFADAVWPLKAGEVYPGLVQTALGFHIVKVTAHEGPGKSSLADVKEVIKPTLKQMKGQMLQANWIRDKRQTAVVALDPKFAALLSASQSGGKTSSLNTTTH